MYFKLALKNVKKSYKDYLIYFLTLAFSVCLFYAFNSFQAQQAVLSLSQAQSEIIESINMILMFLSIFVAIVLAFLILYANNFLIKRRKQEFGLYTLLGMPKKNISKVIIYETFMIGILSLITGLCLGYILSQYLTILTASLFEVELNFHFIFSKEATILTILSFSVIFLFVMALNSFVLSRFKLIDLLNASHKHEELKVKNLYVSVILFLLSLILIGFAYHWGLKYGLMYVDKIPQIFIFGIVGTILFFMSLSGFLLKFVQTSKKFYYRNLNMFVLRQINAKINSNFLSMSIVCLMLLLSIGAIATGMSLRNSINSTLKKATPYDYSFNIFQQEAKDAVDELKIDKDTYIKNEDFMNVYVDQVNRNKEMTSLFGNKGGLITNDSTVFFEYIKLSQFNDSLKQQGYDPISLNKDEGYVFSTLDMIDDWVKAMMKEDYKFTAFDHEIKIVNDEYVKNNLATTNHISNVFLGIVIDDSLINEKAELSTSYWNVDLKKGVSSKQFTKIIETKVAALDPEVENYPYQHGYQLVSSDEVRENSIGMSMMFTYIGLYLGIIFILSSAVILALQQLAQADENKKRYAILSDIGCEKRMMDHSVFMQIAIYFMLPLLLGTIHAIVGINIVSNLVLIIGEGNILQSSLVTMGIIILIYGIYFLVTYSGYKRILYK
ncbi:MAG: ABC transporter permease [Erysipelotrichaceae bacterium]